MAKRERVHTVKMFASLSDASGEGIIGAAFYPEQAGHNPKPARLMFERDYRDLLRDAKAFRSRKSKGKSK